MGTDQAVSVWCAEHLDCNLDSENKRDKCRSVVQLETQGKSQQLTVTSCCFRLPAKVTGRDCGEERILSSIANFVLVLCVKGCLCWPHRRRLIQLCLRHIAGSIDWFPRPQRDCGTCSDLQCSQSADLGTICFSAWLGGFPPSNHLSDFKMDVSFFWWRCCRF